MNRFKNPPNGFLVLLGSLTLIMLATVALLVSGHKHIAELTSHIGTPVVLLIMLAWVVFSHSRKRWPDLRWHERLGRLLTYRR